MQSVFTALKILCVLPIYLFSLSPLATTNLFVIIVLPFPECHGVRIPLSLNIGAEHLLGTCNIPGIMLDIEISKSHCPQEAH